MENIITSKDNPVIKLYQKLSSSKKERLQYGLFVLEGYRIVEDALKESANIRNLLITEQSYEKYSEALLQADLRNTRLIVISNELGRKIASTDSTQGVFAICAIPVDRSLSFRQNGRYIILHHLQDPGNLGMIIRTADALGMDGVVMCGCCDLYSPKTIRSTMGSVFRMNIIVENDEDALFEAIERDGVRTYAAVIDKDAVSLTECSFDGTSAVMIGNEGNGLPKDTAARCTGRMIIPMNGNINSLNAAMAAGIFMWELKK